MSNAFRANGNPDHVSAPRGSKTGTQGMKNAEERSTYPKLLIQNFYVGI